MLVFPISLQSGELLEQNITYQQERTASVVVVVDGRKSAIIDSNARLSGSFIAIVTAHIS
jgi:hypothetical protein